MLALINGGGFLRRDEFAGQSHRLAQLLDDQVVPDEIFKIRGGQAFRLQNLLSRNPPAARPGR